MISAIYARCTAMERRELWENLEIIAENNNLSWLVGGDFNVIMNEEEKLGGFPFTQVESLDFAQCVNNCTITKLKDKGSKFTWWNGRIEYACIFKRLDRVIGNQDTRIFKAWYRKTGKSISWEVLFMEFQAKMKKVKKALTGWSKETFGNIFQQIATLEDIIKVKEVQLEILPSAENRMALSKAEGEVKKFLFMDEKYWKQKLGMRWFVNGDRNTKFFHSYVKGRKKKLHISEIQTPKGDTVNSNENIGAEVVKFFEEQFKQTERIENDAMLDNIPHMISLEQNAELVKLLNKEEVRKVVLS
ncbi:hypothetical protein H5410_002849 [Solanum commersonii]|uniref:Reverse transcriptase n=1 Tax=Solanum commersonii TaxID=4109 RepID=A0A9J6B3B4_SOLCO|nr:hypothetical protein H5410_002849 [Solanum commersonii]